MSQWTGTAPPWAATVILLATDSTRQLIAGKPNLQTWLTMLVVTVVTSAAQQVDIKSADGNTVYARIPVSAAVGAQFRIGPFARGIPTVTQNQAINIVPAAAGPSLHVAAEGYYF